VITKSASFKIVGGVSMFRSKSCDLTFWRAPADSYSDLAYSSARAERTLMIGQELAFKVARFACAAWLA
jgi:hypothetical protein